MVFISSLVCKGFNFYGAPFRYFRRNRSWYDCFALFARRSIIWMKMTTNTNYATEQNSLFLTVSPVV